MTKITSLLFVLSMLLSISAKAQEHIVSGIVTDEKNEPLIGATVMLRNTNIGVITDTKGYYRLTFPNNKHIQLQYSYVGMKTIIKDYHGEKTLNIVMCQDDNILGNIEVHANPNINDIDLRSRTGVVQMVDMDRISQRPVIDLGLSLQGAIAGLSVINTGALGSTPTVRIRGNASLRRGNTINEPLYILDGKIISPETFYNLNSADIQSIKVLKDATACALYGTKAANGVLEITSKRGFEGKPTVQYSLNVGLTTRGRRGVRMMDTAEKLEIERLMQNEEAPGYRWSPDYFKRYYANDPHFDELVKEGQDHLTALMQIHTDWFKELIQTSMYESHNLSIRGGGAGIGYYLGADYSKQGGMLKGNDKQRMGLMFNVDYSLGKLGYVMLNSGISVNNTNTPVGSDNDPATLIYQLNPYETTTGQLTSYKGKTLNDLLYQYQQQANDKNANFSVALQLTPISGLQIGAVAGVDYLLGENRRFVPSTAWNESHTGVPEEQRGMVGKSKSTTLNASFNLRTTYQHTFSKKHDLTVGANIDYYYYNYDEVSILGYGVGNINSAAAINQSLIGNRQARISSPRDRNAQLGIGALASYTYKQIYDTYATMKWDAASVLPQSNRWNSAWAVGLGWNLAEYPFIKKLMWLNNLKIKGSYGRMANSNGLSIGQTIGTFLYSDKRYENQRLLQFQNIYNEDLVPEQMVSLDVGMQMTLLKRFDFAFNLYRRTTEQALLDVPIPSSTGYNLLRRNIGVLSNSGIELSTDLRLIESKDWRLILGGKIAHNRNRVEDLYYTNEIFVSETSLVPDYKVGAAYDMIWGVKALFINPLSGYPVFQTPTGEKQAGEALSRSDFTSLGYSTPPFTGGWNFSVSWKNLELNADFYFGIGGKKVFNYQYVRNQDHITKNAVAGQLEKMWLAIGDEGKSYPTPFYTSGTAEQNLYLYPNSMRVGSSDFMRLSMISLRYRVSHDWLSHHLPFLSYTTLGVQASNLATWTAYNEADPEAQLGGSLQPVITFYLNMTF